uniref:(northern house mosquito) hypothetical protein n=1 Tax=Culex pipiens TaxID=7175 RepID=A0A8D8MBG1_CULPI
MTSSSYYLSLLLSAIAVYFLYKLLLLLGTIATTPLLAVANTIYRIYHPPDFPVSYYVLGNGWLSLVTFPFEYAVWIAYKIIAFLVLLPFNCVAFVVRLVLAVFSLFNSMLLSMILVKVVVALISIHYFRNLVAKHIPLDIGDFSMDGVRAILSDWN